MKHIRYQVIVKATGKVLYSNGAWIDKNTNVEDWIKENFNLRLVEVVIY